MHTPICPETLKKIRLIALDVDGVLTDGAINIGPEGELFKSFNVHDGLGLSLARQAGIEIAIITGRQNPIVQHRMNELKIKHVFQNEKEKAKRLHSLCEQLAIPLEQTLYMGDDLPDLKTLTIAGVGVAPQNAHFLVKEVVDWITTASGGQGAVREVCDALLTAKGLLTHIKTAFSSHDHFTLTQPGESYGQ